MLLTHEVDKTKGVHVLIHEVGESSMEMENHHQDDFVSSDCQQF